MILGSILHLTSNLQIMFFNSFRTVLLLVFLCISHGIGAQQPVVLAIDNKGDPLKPPAIVVILDSAQTKPLVQGQVQRHGAVHFSVPVPRGVYPTHLYYNIRQNGKGEETTIDWVDYTRDTVRLTVGAKSIQLEEVVVKAIRQRVKMDAKGASLNLSSFPDAKLWTLEDALRQIPGVEFSTGAITFQGQEVQFKENGFASPHMTRNIDVYLKMPASNFTDIKILMRDMSLLDNGASINLTHAKRSAGETWGNVQGNAGLYDQKISALAGVKKKNSLFSIAPLTTFQSPAERTSESHRQWTDRSRESHTFSNRDAFSRMGSLNGHYNLNFGKHLLDVNVFFNARDNRAHYRSFTENYQLDTLYDHYKSNSNSNTFNNNLIFSAGYYWKIDPESHLYISFKGEFPQNDNRNGREAIDPSLNYDQHRYTKDNNYFSMISYERKHRRYGDFEIGAKYFNREQQTSSDYTWYGREQYGDSVRSSYYRNTYNYGAVFASWSRTFGKYAAFMTFTADYSEDRIPTYSNKRYNYLTVSPYLSLFRNLNGHNVRITTGYQEKRPQIYMLNPVADLQPDPTGLVVDEGNPALLPSKKTWINSSYSSILFNKLNMSIDLNYFYEWDGFQNVNFTKDTIIVRKFMNMSSEQRISLAGNLNYPFTERLSSSFSFSLSPSFIRPDQSQPDTRYDYYRGNLYLIYRIIKNKLLASVNTSYSKYEFFQQSESGHWTTGLFLSFRPNEQWSIGLNCSNLMMPDYSRKSELYGIGYTTYMQTSGKQSDISLSVQYSFGKNKTAKKVKEIKIDDM